MRLGSECFRCCGCVADTRAKLTYDEVGNDGDLPADPLLTACCSSYSAHVPGVLSSTAGSGRKKTAQWWCLLPFANEVVGCRLLLPSEQAGRASGARKSRSLRHSSVLRDGWGLRHSLPVVVLAAASWSATASFDAGQLLWEWTDICYSALGSQIYLPRKLPMTA
jgi:hypothetical protein